MPGEKRFSPRLTAASRSMPPRTASSVALSGTSQGVAFRAQGNLVVTSAIDRSTTRNGVNALDIFLITGNPYLPNAAAGTISAAAMLV